MNTGGASGFGSMAQSFTGNMAGVGNAVIYGFMLMGLILAGFGIHGFYSEHKSGRGEYGKAAMSFVVGVILTGGLLYFINTGSNTMGAGTNSQIQTLVNP